jgi:hypothetical protein
MAVKHRAYLFRRDSLESILRQVTTPSGRLDSNALLQRLNSDPVLQAQAATEFMHDLGVGLACIDGTESQAELEETLFLIALAGTLRARSTLANRAFAAVEIVLPLLGWSNDNVSLLLCGRSAHELTNSLNVPGFAPAFELNRGGSEIGWLSTTGISACASRLDAHTVDFLRPDRRIVERLTTDRAIAMLSGGITPEELLSVAYNEIMERLKVSLAESSELILFNDVRTYGTER